MMNLMTGLLGLGGHLGGWRHKDAWSDNVMNLEHAIETAQTAERGLFDLLFLADCNAVRQMGNPALFAANHPSRRLRADHPADTHARRSPREGARHAPRYAPWAIRACPPPPGRRTDVTSPPAMPTASSPSPIPSPPARPFTPT